MATASELRRLNQRRILEAMLRLKRASRTQLAREAGMSQPTVSRIVDHLLTQGILNELGMEGEGVGDGMGVAEKEGGDPGVGTGVGLVRPRTTAGRPSTPLELDRSRARFLAIRLGVRKTHVAAVPVGIGGTGGGGEGDLWDEEFETPGSGEAWGRRLSEVLERVRPATLEAAVVSMPGVIDEAAGRVFLSPNLRWTEKADFSSLLSPMVRAPLYFLQEIRGLALGHMAMSRDADDFLLVDFGSGVGAAAVMGSRTYQGALPLSGEIGHTPIVGNDRQCGCGATGCIETRISRTGLLASAAEQGVFGGKPPEWEGFVRWLETLSAMPDWLDRDLRAAAYVIAAAVNVLGLRQVVITGYVEELPGAFRSTLVDLIQKSAMWSRFGTVRCQLARRQRLAGMVCTAMQRTY